MDRGRDREGWRWTEGGIGRGGEDRGRDREGWRWTEGGIGRGGDEQREG